MKKLLLCVALAAASLTVQAKDAAPVPADQWQVKALFQYVKDDGTTSPKILAMDFTVATGECKNGISRTMMPSPFNPKETIVTQKTCIEKEPGSNRTHVTGWMMTPTIVGDIGGERGKFGDVRRDRATHLDYGKPIDIVFVGDYVQMQQDGYEVEIRRISSATPSVTPQKTTLRNGVDGKKVAAGKKVNEGKHAKEGKDMEAQDNAFAPQMIR